MNCVGIDVSKGKSTVAVMCLGGEVVIPPYDVAHTVSELNTLTEHLKSLDGETHVVIESTGNYHAPVAWWLHDSGFYVSVVNPMLTRNYGDNSVRYPKTDKWDARKLGKYGLACGHFGVMPKTPAAKLLVEQAVSQLQATSAAQATLRNEMQSLWQRRSRSTLW